MAGPTSAVVRDCIDDADVVVVKATGLPAPGMLGRRAYERVTSVMHLTAQGWKLTNQTVEAGPCAA